MVTENEAKALREEVREALALDALYSRQMLAAVTNNMSLIRAFTQDADHLLRIAVTDNILITPELLTVLAADENAQVRYHVTQHPKSPPPALFKLMLDSEHWVAAPIIRHRLPELEAYIRLQAVKANIQTKPDDLSMLWILRAYGISHNDPCCYGDVFPCDEF